MTWRITKKKIEFSLFKRAVENIRKFFVLITISNTSKNIIFRGTDNKHNQTPRTETFFHKLCHVNCFVFFYVVY